ncbi:MAG TPA: hypothetical protein VN452_00975 [Longilinea sp.]|nr:hypothetical protein [Longilinea sp.]
MKNVGSRSFHFGIIILVIVSFILSACNSTATVPAPITSNPSQVEPLAELTFEVTPPAGSSSSAKLSLEVLDEITGLALNPARYPMTAIGAGRFSVKLALVPGTLVKYRYLRDGTPPAVEYDSTNKQIRYRTYRVTGTEQVQDSIAAWNDIPFSGQTGRIRGQAMDAVTREPIPNLMVIAAGISSVTASDGSFLLEGIPVGTHMMVASSLDGKYTTFQQGATIAADATTPAVIALTPAQMVNLTFVVKPPEGNLAGVPIRMVGNLLSLGDTFADLSGGMSIVSNRAPLLSLRDDGSYTLSLSLPAGFDLRYKYTLGDGFWNGELTSNGGFLTRQLIVPSADTTSEEQIEAWGTSASAPITFTVNVPVNTPATDSVSIQFNPFGWMEPIPMWPLGDHKYTYILYNPMSMLGDVGYRYCRNEMCGVADNEETAGPSSPGKIFKASALAQTFEDTVSAWHWWQTQSNPTTVLAPEIINRGSSFWVGAEFQPGYQPNWQPHYGASFQTIKGIGANTVVIPMTWTFTNNSKPVLKAIPGIDPLWSDLTQQVALAQQSGLKVIIAPYVRFEKSSQDWWKSAVKDSGWWDSFFDQYATFLRNAADFATVNNATALILGDSAIAPAYSGGTLNDGSPANLPDDIAARWEDLIAQTRTRFTGQFVLQLVYSGSESTPPLPLNLFDAFYVNWSVPLTSSDSPSESDLEAEFGRLMDEQLAPFQTESGKPLILALSFASASGAAKQCVSINGNCLPNIALSQPYLELQSIPVNLQAQVDLYNAALGAINNRDWISGVIVKGFYPPVALQDASISTNGKPAMDVLWYWFPRLTGEIGQ